MPQEVSHDTRWLPSNRTYQTHNHPERRWERHIHTADKLELVGTATGATQDEAEALANLQSAAPELLATLKQFVLDHEMSGMHCAGLNATYFQALAVIKKAEGR